MRENLNAKFYSSNDYNYYFRKDNGFFLRWGKTIEDDPDFAPFPELLDIEVTTKCNGVPGLNGINSPCKFCYKSNTPNGSNMSLDTFKNILDKLPKSESGSHFLTQIAFGADSEATSNPELWDMMSFCREQGVIPNITVANISDETADKLVAHCGAVAVSRYDNKDVCYDSVKRLTDRGLEQTNIHIMVSENTYDQVMETLQDRLTDERLSKLRAIVLLSLKKKGRGTNYNQLSFEKFKSIVDFAMENKITIGFDSCSCSKFEKSIEDHPQKEKLIQLSERCESNLFSLYINKDGVAFPCSFTEGTMGWVNGINVLEVKDFKEDLWEHPRMQEWRSNLLKCKRTCPIFNV